MDTEYSTCIHCGREIFRVSTFPWLGWKHSHNDSAGCVTVGGTKAEPEVTK